MSEKIFFNKVVKIISFLYLFDQFYDCFAIVTWLVFSIIVVQNYKERGTNIILVNEMVLLFENMTVLYFPLLVLLVFIIAKNNVDSKSSNNDIYISLVSKQYFELSV